MNENDGKQIGTRIKSVRVSKGMTMEEFGGQLSPKASKGTISKWENGRYLPNNDRLKQIAEIGNVSINYLLEGKYTLKDIHIMPEEEKIKLFQQGSAFFDTSSDDYLLMMVERFSNEIKDDQIKKNLAISLDSLVEIKNGNIPKDYLDSELKDISEWFKELPYKVSKL